ncbi:MAG: hypothetical protein RIR01_2112 [Bacteroidota bacterium]|jgi:hypothetical protein
MLLGITQPPFKSYGGFRNLNTPAARLPFLQEGEDLASNALLSRISQQVSQQDAQQPKKKQKEEPSFGKKMLGKAANVFADVMTNEAFTNPITGPFFEESLLTRMALRNLSENINPYNYDDVDVQTGAEMPWYGRAVNTVLGQKEPNRILTEKAAQQGVDPYTGKPSNEARTRIDLLNMFANKPQQYGTLQPSEYKPSIGAQEGSKYMKSKAIESDILNNMFTQTEQGRKILESGIRSEADLEKLLTESGLPYEKGKGGYVMKVPGLGQGTLGVKKDKKGTYLSYSDVWDVDPTSGTSGENTNLLSTALGKFAKGGFISPQKVYGRIYFDEKTGKPKK